MFRGPSTRAGHGHPEAFRDASGQILVDLGEHAQHPLADRQGVDLAQLEAEGLHDMPLLRRGLAVPEQGRLAEVVEELLAARPLLLGVDGLRVADESAQPAARLHRASAAQRVRVIARLADVERLAHVPVADLEVTMGTRPAGVDHALGNPLVIEMRDLLAEDEVLEERRPSGAGLQ